MRTLVAVTVLIAFCATITVGAEDEPFANRLWKKRVVNSLDFSIYLPKRFKPQRENDPDYVIFGRKNPVVVIGILRYPESFGQLSKAQAKEFVDDLWFDLWLWSSVDYFSEYDPTLITNCMGQNGWQWLFMEMGKGMKDYYWNYEIFFDANGYVYVLITTAGLNLSPHFGSGVTFWMHRGVLKSLRRPMVAAPAAEVVSDLTRRIRNMKRRMLKKD